MNKKELFEKYDLNKSHNVDVNEIDSRLLIQLHVNEKGELPPEDDNGLWVLDFLQKCKDDVRFMRRLFIEQNLGGMHNAAKNYVYRHADSLLSALKKK